MRGQFYDSQPIRASDGFLVSADAQRTDYDCAGHRLGASDDVAALLTAPGNDAGFSYPLADLAVADMVPAVDASGDPVVVSGAAPLLQATGVVSPDNYHVVTCLSADGDLVLMQGSPYAALHAGDGTLLAEFATEGGIRTAGGIIYSYNVHGDGGITYLPGPER